MKTEASPPASRRALQQTDMRVQKGLVPRASIARRGSGNSSFPEPSGGSCALLKQNGERIACGDAEGKNNETFFAKGKRGLVFLRTIDGKTVLIKRKNPSAAVDTLANEARFTKLLNAAGVGPRFISYEGTTSELVREYVDGLEFRKWMSTATEKQMRLVLLSVLRQCKEMDDLGVDKEEMTRPWKHIIVTPTSDAFLIDFERCRSTRLPKNVTQFCQFVVSAALTARLNKLNISIEKQNLLDLAKLYKQSIKVDDYKKRKKAYHEMIALVKNA